MEAPIVILQNAIVTAGTLGSNFTNIAEELTLKSAIIRKNIKGNFLGVIVLEVTCIYSGNSTNNVSVTT